MAAWPTCQLCCDFVWPNHCRFLSRCLSAISRAVVPISQRQARATTMAVRMRVNMTPGNRDSRRTLLAWLASHTTPELCSFVRTSGKCGPCRLWPRIRRASEPCTRNIAETGPMMPARQTCRQEQRELLSQSTFGYSRNGSEHGYASPNASRPAPWLQLSGNPG